jgi:glyoxylase-like metal-dependent hydrolase (beta-lactamase superfamily II)
MERGPVSRIGAVSGANAWLVPTGEGLVLVDTGLPGNARAIVDVLATLGHAPAELRAIVLTHADPDHTGSAAELRALTGAPVAIHAHDAPVLAGRLTSRRAKGPLRVRTLPYRLARLGHEAGMALLLRLAPRRSGWRPLTADILLQDGDTVAGLRVLHVPGHTAGSVALHREDGVLLAGDAVFGDGAGRAHYPPRATALDPDAARASARRLMSSGFTVLYPGHGRAIPGPSAPRGDAGGSIGA